eukprot:scaffold33195_cov75-Cyclotella_meneghiniana.AAC.1
MDAGSFGARWPDDVKKYIPTRRTSHSGAKCPDIFRGVSRFCPVDFGGIGKIPGLDPSGRDNPGRDDGTGFPVGVGRDLTGTGRDRA